MKAKLVNESLDEFSKNSGFILKKVIDNLGFDPRQEYNPQDFDFYWPEGYSWMSIIDDRQPGSKWSYYSTAEGEVQIALFKSVPDAEGDYGDPRTPWIIFFEDHNNDISDIVLSFSKFEEAKEFLEIVIGKPARLEIKK